MSYAGEQAVANLLKMKRAAEAFESSGAAAPTLRQFLRRAMRDVEELREEGESALADDRLDAVRVMSIHRSKGLEWPVVFLPDLGRGAQRPASHTEVAYDWPRGALGVVGSRFVDPGGAALGHLRRRVEREESRRVLYVAMTRARERLILSGAGAARSGTWASQISEALVAAGGPDLPSAAGPVEAGTVRMEVSRIAWKEPPARRERAAKEIHEAPDWKAHHRAWKEREKEREAVVASPRFTSPSRLQDAQEKRIVGGSDEDPERRIAAAATGTLCHLVLERLDFAKPDLDALVPSCAAELGVGDPSEARGILEKFLESPAFRELAEGEILARELPFLRPHEGGILQGVIDLVVRRGKKVSVVDYKTDREEHPERYGAQKKHYVEAVRELLGAKGADFQLLYLRTGRFVAP